MTRQHRENGAVSLLLHLLLNKNFTEHKSYQRSCEKDLQAESNREAEHSQLNPVAEPVGYTVMHEGGEKRNRGNNQADGKGLDGKNQEHGIVSSGCYDAECQFLCRFCNDKENQAEDNDVFQPHFLNSQGKDLRTQTAHVHGDGVTGHAKDHAEYHHECEDDTLKFCFWHKNPPVNKNKHKKRHETCPGHQTSARTIFSVNMMIITETQKKCK